MELHHIRYFAALAEALNYTQAAEECFITRQAMRQAVQALEREFGVPLVENRRNKLALTPAGTLFARKGEALLSACDVLEASMRAFVAEAHPVRLGVSVSLVPFYAPEVLKMLQELREPFPSLRLEHALADSDALLDRLEAGELDAAIVVDLGGPEGKLRRAVLRRDALGVLMSVSHPLAGGEGLTLEDLDGRAIAFMSRPERCFRPLWSALAARGIRVEYRVVPESVEAFQAVRREGILALDRLEHDGDGPIALEKDLPLTDFPAQLEVAMLYPESAPPFVRLLAEYLEGKAQGGFA